MNNEDEKESAGISLADNCNVYVAGLPKRANEDIIRKEFSRFGTIQHVNLVRDYDTHVSKCFCYIMFANGKAANEAIKVMNKQQVFNEWSITVEHAKRRMLPNDPRIQKSIQARIKV